MILCASEAPKKIQINTEDYENIERPSYSVNKSVEQLTKNSSITRLTKKKTINQLLSSNKLINSLKQQLKGSKRYDNSLPYKNSKDSYTDNLGSDTINLSNIETKDQSTYRMKKSHLLGARYNSQRRLQNNSSANTIGLEKYEILEKLPYKHPKSK